jgi:RecB family exonuclease
MQVTTTYNNPKSKPFAWSFSKLKNFETCPKRHYHIDIKKDVKEEESEMLAFGNALHEALAKRIKDQTPLPKPYAEYETWAQKLEGPGQTLVEQKLAITADYAPCTFFDNKAWYRGVADVIKINKSVALALDWKTGKIKEDSVQLALMAACVFAHHPQVQRIRSEFVWLQHDATTRIDVTRDDIVKLWVTLKPRIDQLKQAYDTNTFPPKQGGLCRKWCPVTQCQYHGGE